MSEKSAPLRCLFCFTIIYATGGMLYMKKMDLQKSDSFLLIDPNIKAFLSYGILFPDVLGILWGHL